MEALVIYSLHLEMLLALILLLVVEQPLLVDPLLVFQEQSR
jgi:hypothetical protein